MLVSLLQNRPLFQAICPGSLWARDNRWLLSRVQRLAGPAGGSGAFCPGWRHQLGQMGGLLSLLVDPTGTKGPRSLLSWLEPPTGIKGPPFCPGWCLQPGQKAPVPPAGPASRWTRDKRHLLSRAQRLPGQMAWNKDLFCSSVFTIASYYQIMN